MAGNTGIAKDLFRSKDLGISLHFVKLLHLESFRNSILEWGWKCKDCVWIFFCLINIYIHIHTCTYTYVLYIWSLLYAQDIHTQVKIKRHFEILGKSPLISSPVPYGAGAVRCLLWDLTQNPLGDRKWEVCYSQGRPHGGAVTPPRNGAQLPWKRNDYTLSWVIPAAWPVRSVRSWFLARAESS